MTDQDSIVLMIILKCKGGQIRDVEDIPKYRLPTRNIC